MEFVNELKELEHVSVQLEEKVIAIKSAKAGLLDDIMETERQVRARVRVRSPTKIATTINTTTTTNNNTRHRQQSQYPPTTLATTAPTASCCCGRRRFS